MKTSLFLLVSGLALLISCDNGVQPLTDFTFRGEPSPSFVMATYDTVSLFNLSENAEQVSWDFGDGRSSTENKPVLSYEKSGKYDVRLSITGKGGEQRAMSKSVTVKDRVLRSVDIAKVYWTTSNENGWPTTPQADIFLQIQEYTDAAMTSGYLCPSCPVVYTSAVIPNVSNNVTTGIKIPVAEKIIIDKKLLKFASPENVGSAYLISLMAKDKDGKVYCLQSNRGGGTYFGVLKENLDENEFVVQNGPFSDYRLMCVFE